MRAAWPRQLRLRTALAIPQSRSSAQFSPPADCQRFWARRPASETRAGRHGQLRSAERGRNTVIGQPESSFSMNGAGLGVAGGAGMTGGAVRARSAERAASFARSRASRESRPAGRGGGRGGVGAARGIPGVVPSGRQSPILLSEALSGNDHPNPAQAAPAPFRDPGHRDQARRCRRDRGPGRVHRRLGGCITAADRAFRHRGADQRPGRARRPGSVDHDHGLHRARRLLGGVRRGPALRTRRRPAGRGRAAADPGGRPAHRGGRAAAPRPDAADRPGPRVLAQPRA
jgi:hypothetical protein